MNVIGQPAATLISVAAGYDLTGLNSLEPR